MRKSSRRTSSSDTVKTLKRISRELNKGMPVGGPHSTKKGAKGYNRKVKHKKEPK